MADGNETTQTGAGVPSDNTTLVAVLGELREAGFTADFLVVEGARLRCRECGGHVPGGHVPLDLLRRVEGASDPADMAAVLGVTCPHCGSRGSAVVRYGPEANENDTDLLLALDDDRL